jgi:hypothetical protein
MYHGVLHICTYVTDELELTSETRVAVILLNKEHVAASPIRYRW